MKKIVVFLSSILMFICVSINVSAESYVDNILVDDKQIAGFSADKTTYDLEVAADKEKIKIVMSYDTKKYQGSGSSTESQLNYGLNVLKYTLKDIETKEEVVTYTINVTRKDNRSSDNSLSSLTVANQKINLTDKTSYNVNVDSTLKTVEIKAVLNDEKSSFVTGFGERLGNNAVKLNGETTKTEIKVQAENKDIKTYTINIIKTDYKSNDATLKSLKIDKINFEFQSTVYEYNLNCEYDIESIVLEAIPNYENATLNYEKNIDLNIGVNNIVLKVVAEDETTKEYKINITRLEKSYLVENIEIVDVDFQFEKGKFDYEIETDLTQLDFNLTLNTLEEKTEITEIGNLDLKNNSQITIKVKYEDEEENYNFVIISEQDLEEEDINLDEDNANSLDKFLEKNGMLVGLTAFGIGVFLMLIAILYKVKSKKM